MTTELVNQIIEILHFHNISNVSSRSVAIEIAQNLNVTPPNFDQCERYDDCDEINHYWVWIFIPVVFVMSIAGVLVPSLIDRYLPNSKILQSAFFKCLQGVAAGFILTVALIHCIGEAVEVFAECITSAFGYAALAALMGMIATWTIELIIGTFMARRRVANTIEVISESSPDLTTYGSLERHHDDDAGEHGTCPSETVATVFEEDKTHLVDLFILLFGLSFHTFFIGTALGLSDDKTLFFALLFHQFFEALALGLHLSKASKKSWKLPIVVTLVFSLSGPVGGFIGVGIAQSVCKDPFAFLIIEAIFNSFAGGILVFIGSVHMIAEEFTKQKDVVNNWKNGLSAWLGVIIGSALMSIICIWA